MNRTTLIIAFLISISFAFGQKTPQANSGLLKKADSLFKAKDYKNSAFTYSVAMRLNGGKGSINEHYRAACAYALANIPDSAFFNLTWIATQMNYMNYSYISTDPNLDPLHTDKRWDSLLDIIKQNKDKVEANYNRPLIAELDSILNDDQKYRKQSAEIEKNFGRDSKEMKDHLKIISEKDSINQVKVKAILDKYGWLGTDVVGSPGNSTLFLVILHSDLATQSKYLPMIREAVKNGRAQGNNLALLEDKVALGLGKRQVYGSQVRKDPETQNFYILPLEDPDNVDKRRAEVGLQPLGEYVSHWNIIWNAEQYKKDLPGIEAKQKANLK